MMNVRVNLGSRSYEIAITTSNLADLGPFARQRCRGVVAFIVTDEHAAVHATAAASSLTGASFQTTTEILPAGEACKSLEVAAKIYDKLADLRADRSTLIVALGGGVIGDLTGFVAATYARGLPVLMVPTTLLAMVDSSIGGKVAVNHAKAKNLIGAFHQPIGVWIDTATLETLPEREYRSGLAEVVKYGVILDADLFAFLEGNVAAVLGREADALRHIIARCCRLKADIVEQDEREEGGLRMVLNYGHTFAHAFETVAGYGVWLHGEAVAAGMICASRLAERRGLITHELTIRQQRLLSALRLPTAPGDWLAADLLDVMRRDKKAQAGQWRFVLPRRLGEAAVFDDISETEVRAVLEQART